MSNPTSLAIKAAFSKDWNRLMPEHKANLLHYLVDDTLDTTQYIWAFKTFLPHLANLFDDIDEFEQLVGGFADVRKICWSLVKRMMTNVEEWSSTDIPLNWLAIEEVLSGRMPKSKVCSRFTEQEWYFWAKTIFDEAVQCGAAKAEVLDSIFQFFDLHCIKPSPELRFSIRSIC